MLLQHTSPAFMYFLLLFNNVFVSRQAVFFQVSSARIPRAIVLGGWDSYHTYLKGNSKSVSLAS